MLKVVTRTPFSQYLSFEREDYGCDFLIIRTIQ